MVDYLRERAPHEEVVNCLQVLVAQRACRWILEPMVVPPVCCPDALTHR